MQNRCVSCPDLQINGNQNELVTKFNFLGLALQSNQSWNKHINHIFLKVSKTIGIIHRLKFVYPLSVLLTFYNRPYSNGNGNVNENGGVGNGRN